MTAQLTEGERKTLEKIKRLLAEGHVYDAQHLIKTWLRQAHGHPVALEHRKAAVGELRK